MAESGHERVSAVIRALPALRENPPLPISLLRLRRKQCFEAGNTFEVRDVAEDAAIPAVVGVELGERCEQAMPGIGNLLPGARIRWGIQLHSMQRARREQRGEVGEVALDRG